MEKETIGLKAMIMFDMLLVLLNMMEMCTKLQCSPNIFDRFTSHQVALCHVSS